MEEVVRVAVCGCGRIGAGVHLPVLAALPGVRISAVADPSEPHRGAALARVPGARAYATLDHLLGESRPDAVVIASPSPDHESAAMAAIEAGCHVYLEKPIATTVAAGERIVAAAAAQLTVMTGFNYRFNPLFAECRRLLAAGAAGRLTAVRSVFSVFESEPPNWKLSAPAGGVLADLASHHADLARWFTASEPAAVRARVWNTRFTDDTATVELRMSGGVTVQSLFTLSGPEDDRWEFFGDRGRLTVDRHAALAPELRPATLESGRRAQLAHWARSAARAGYLWRKRRSPAWEPSYPAALAHFIDSIRRRTAASPGLPDGLAALRTTEAARRSAALGDWVAL